MTAIAERPQVPPDLVAAYLRGQARAFFPAHPTDGGARRHAVERAVRPLAPAVAEALAVRNARLPASTERDAHLASLRRGAAAVVTGQQVGLFLGPLFTLYKAASAVRVARALAAETGRPVVPIFWLQTEDHDLPEIATCGVPGVGALALPASPAARTSIAHLALPSELEACLAQLRRALGPLPHAEEHLARLERHYRPGAGWAESFAGVLAELFAPEGLVLVDPRDPALADAARPVHERALAEADPIAAALVERAAALEAAGFRATVHVRPGAPLAFYHPDGPAGPRYRLQRAGDDAYVEVGGTGRHARRDLLAALAAEARAFSTSALLRPILQDTLLPTAAYVAGPGEVAYFAQLAPLYEHFGVPMPLVVPRARFRLVEDRIARLLDRLGLAPAEAERPEDELLTRARRGESAAGQEHESEVVRARLLAAFDGALAEFAPALRDAGPDVAKGVAKTRYTVERAVGKLVARYERARLRRDGELLEAVRRVRDALLPGGAPQERCHGLPYWGARIGDRALVERVLAAIDPYDPTPKDLRA